MFRRTIAAIGAILGSGGAIEREQQAADLRMPDAVRGEGIVDVKYPSFKRHKDRKLPRELADEKAGSPRFGRGKKTSTSALRANRYGLQLHGPTGNRYISYAQHDKNTRCRFPMSAESLRDEPAVQP